MNEQLKPCPFCGGPAEFHVERGYGKTWSKVRCLRCNAENGHQDEYDEDKIEQSAIDTIAAWNKRVEDEK